MTTIKLFIGCAFGLLALGAKATTTPFNLSAGNLTQNWGNAAQITVNDDWSGVPSIVGFRGDGLAGATARCRVPLVAAAVGRSGP